MHLGFEVNLFLALAVCIPGLGRLITPQEMAQGIGVSGSGPLASQAPEEKKKRNAVTLGSVKMSKTRTSLVVQWLKVSFQCRGFRFEQHDRKKKSLIDNI